MPVTDVADVLSKLKIYPSDRTIDEALSQKLRADFARPENQYFGMLKGGEVVGLFVDLDGDGMDEFVLLSGATGLVYQQRDTNWRQVGRIYDRAVRSRGVGLASELSKGQVRTKPAPWNDLWIGSHRFQVDPNGPSGVEAATVAEP